MVYGGLPVPEVLPTTSQHSTTEAATQALALAQGPAASLLLLPLCCPTATAGTIYLCRRPIHSTDVHGPERAAGWPLPCRCIQKNNQKCDTLVTTEWFENGNKVTNTYPLKDNW